MKNIIIKDDTCGMWVLCIASKTFGLVDIKAHSLQDLLIIPWLIGKFNGPSRQSVRYLVISRGTIVITVL